MTLIDTFAAERGISSETVKSVVRQSAFRYVKPVLVTDRDIEGLIAQAKALGVDPLSGEIRAALNGSSVRFYLTADGYLSIANSHPQMDGLELLFPPREEWTQVRQLDGKTVTCPEWVGAKIYRKDRKVPYEVREYLDEAPVAPVIGANGVFVDSQWQKTPKRLLINKAVSTAVRFAFGVSGTLSEDESEVSDAAPEKPAEKPKKAEPSAKAQSADAVKAEETSEAKKAEPQPAAEEMKPAAQPAPAPQSGASPKEAEPEPAGEKKSEPQDGAADRAASDEKAKAVRKAKVDGIVDEVIGRMKSGKATLEQAQKWASEFKFFTEHERTAALGRIAMAAVAA